MPEFACPPLSRDAVAAVIEGRGAAPRVPILLHQWINPRAFGEREAAVRAICDRWPCDVQPIRWTNVDRFRAPDDDPSYRWADFDPPPGFDELPIDEQVVIADWAQFDRILADFPDPDYPRLWGEPPAPDGRYRLAHWWYCLFERHWSLRGMTNALMDFYTDPDRVHRLYRALTDFYKRMMTRASEELGADGIYTTDDIGTQTGPFFAPAIFHEFFAPYYGELIEHAHGHGMHFWLHTCGNVEAFLPDLIAMGLDVIHPIQKYAMDEVTIARRHGGEITFWAGFDVQQIIPYGTPDEVRAEVRHLFDTYRRPDGRFLFTAGNGLTPDTPLPSLEALFEEAFAYGADAGDPGAGNAP